MKKLTILILALICSFTINAQKEQLKEDKFSITISPLNNSFIKDTDILKWNIGLEISQFAIDKLSIITGINYGQTNNNPIMSVSMGAKYYLFNHIPLGANLNASMGRENFGNYFPIYSGLSIGAAFFIADKFIIEPTFQYNIYLANDSFFSNKSQAFINLSFNF